MIKSKKSKDKSKSIRESSVKNLMKKTLIIHPFLFGLFPILFLYSYNIRELPFTEILIPSAIVLGFTAISVTLLWLILKKDGKKSGIITSCFLVLFFSYGRVYDMIQGANIGTFTIGRHRYLMALWAVLFILGLYFTIRTSRDLRNFTNILNIVAIVLVLFSLSSIGIYKLNTARVEEVTTESDQEEIYELDEYAITPDIYYIILDGYASSNTLREVYGYDNSEFEDYLVEKGFYIAAESTSNYAMSFLSMASSLNMEYINYLSDTLGKDSKSLMVPYQMIKNSKVMNYLKTKGYIFINFSSGWGPTDDNQYADLNITFSGFNEFQTKLVQTSMLDAFANKYFLRDSARDRILDTFSKLGEMYEFKGNKFIFAHIICPHPPYLFDKNGGVVEETKASINNGNDWKLKENYINQLIFVNKKVEMMVDKILLNSGVPPIIILQADHGTASTFPVDPITGELGNWDNLAEDISVETYNERMKIFNAYYLPFEGDCVLYDSVTPVNTFRLIFNYYFNTDYELLDDKCYFSYDFYYDFIDVTDLVNEK